MNKELIAKGRGKRGAAAAGGDTAYYEQENRSLREKIEEDAAVIAKLREDLAASNIRVSGFAEEKAELDKRIRAQTKRIEELERDNNNLMRKSQTVEEKSKEVSKQKSDNVKAAQQMAQENEVLREEVCAIFIHFNHAHKHNLVPYYGVWFISYLEQAKCESDKGAEEEDS
ncbi:hypothetical protein EON65_05380 [archaeon]|nr:MAG: hypothetical protein EON65_05380 [archaeon]